MANAAKRVASKSAGKVGRVGTATTTAAHLTVMCWEALISSINNTTIIKMADVASLLDAMRKNPRGIRFNDLKTVCGHYFGAPRQSATSHCIYKMPWPGDPRVNIQNHKGKAKPYQVRQVLLAIERLEVSHGS